MFKRFRKIAKLEARIKELEREMAWWKEKALNFRKYGG